MLKRSYDDVYADFDSALSRKIRERAYGVDLGQHSWVTADDLRADTSRLALTAASRFIDLGCGPCGPLTFILTNAGCTGTGVELSESALRVGRARAERLGVSERMTTRQADLNDPLPFDDASFDAAVALDVVLHLRDRARLFADVTRFLRPGGRFLFTDAGVVTGIVSSEEFALRSGYGFTRYVPPGVNEQLIEQSGLHLIDTEDRTGSVVRNARGRLEAMQAYRTELEASIGADAFAQQQRYVDTVLALAERRAVSRVMYLAEKR